MRVNILCNEVFNGWEPTDTRLGGTEEGIVRWAEELVKRGHLVTVFRNGKTIDKSKHNGVGYQPRQDYVDYYNYADICLNHKSPEIVPYQPTLYITTETDATNLDLSKFDGVVWPSNWAKDNIPVNNDNVFVVPYGYDPKQIYPGKKIPKQCFYASSPDRGLDTLLKAWPAVMRAHPDATLLVTYGAEPRNIPGVTFLGECDDEMMNDIYSTSEYWLHPCNGGELYCITGIKAQVAQCVPIIIPTMALAETVRSYINLHDAETYQKVLPIAIGDPLEKEAVLSKLSNEHYPTWSDSVDSLMKIIETVVK